MSKKHMKCRKCKTDEDVLEDGYCPRCSDEFYRLLESGAKLENEEKEEIKEERDNYKQMKKNR